LAIKRQDPRERFFARIDKTPGHGPRGDCWMWDNPSKHTGYGFFYFQGKQRTAHTMMLYFETGRWPDKGLDTDHLCRNRACVNPKHLEIVTRRVNAIRGECGWKTGAKMRERTHCKNGHEFTPENTHFERKGRSIKRRCRKCGCKIQERVIAKKQGRV